MEERKQSVDVEALLAESRWMEGLARHLVGPSGAEDLVQDTLAAALQHAPAERTGLAPWLVVVLRRLGRDRLRGDANRRARELAAARSEILPASVDLVGRAEQHRLLVDAVLALREPYRTVLLLRYFEDLSANEIARRHGAPPATVRSQCARALEMLRGELDRRHGGERGDWTRALALAFNGLGAPSKIGGTATLSFVPTLAAWATGIGIVVLLAAFGWVSLSKSNADASAPLAPLSRGNAAVGVPGVGHAAERDFQLAETDVDATRAAFAPVEPLDAQSTAGTGMRGARIRGRVLLSGGVPASAATLVLVGSLPNVARGMDPSTFDAWRDCSSASSADGGFEVSFDPPPALEFTLRIAREGYTVARWSWSTIEPGRTIDLGDVVLREAATLLVSLVDGTGQIPAGQWQITVTAQDGSGGDGREDFLVHAPVDPALGVVRVEGVPAGRVSLGAFSILTGPVVSANLALEPRELREVQLVYDGPDPAKRILVHTVNRPRYPVRPSEDAFVLRGAGIERRSRTAPRIHGAHVFDDVEPGHYSVHLEDGRFAPWSASGVESGQRVVANLSGAAALALRVVDDHTDTPIAEYGVRVRLERTNVYPNPFTLRELGSRAAGEERLGGLVPLPQTLLVEASGYAVTEVPLLDLAPDEVRPVTARLARPSLLAGVVLRADGSPAVGASVQAVEPGHPALHPHPGNSRGVRRESTLTDERGHFAFEDLLASTWDLFAWEQPWGIAHAPGVELARGERRDDLQLTLPPAAHIHGHIRDLPDAACAELELAFAPDHETVVARAFLGRPGESIPVGADGSFASGPLPPGRISVRLRFPDFERLVRMTSGSGFGGVATSSGQPGKDRVVIEVDLEPGEKRRLDLYLGGDLPACITVRVSGMDSPDRFGVMALAPLEPFSRGASARFQHDGSARLGPLLPGPYELHLYALSSPGYRIDPRIHSLAPGEHREVRLAGSLVSSTLLVREAGTGLPLRSTPVSISSPSDPQRIGITFDTDDEGRLPLELLPGTYQLSRVRAGLFQHGPQTEVDWTPAGPTVDSIELE